MPKIAIELDERTYRFLTSRIESGQAASEDDLVSDALTLLAECERTAEGQAMILRAAARVGFEGAEGPSAVLVQPPEEWDSFWSDVQREAEADETGNASPHAKTAA